MAMLKIPSRITAIRDETIDTGCLTAKDIIVRILLFV
jgi:hypothetical protein